MFHKFIAENPDGISESMQRTHLFPAEPDCVLSCTRFVCSEQLFLQGKKWKEGCAKNSASGCISKRPKASCRFTDRICGSAMFL